MEKRVINAKEVEDDKERVVDITAINLIANFQPTIPDSSLTTIADKVEKELIYFFRAVQANGPEHVRVSLDKMVTSGKMKELFKTESKHKRLMAMAGILSLNIKPYLDKEYVAWLFGFGDSKQMAALVPELCRNDGCMRFERGRKRIREMLRMIVDYHTN